LSIGAAIALALAPLLIIAYPFGTPVGYTVGQHPHSIVAGDFNGDGKLDLATANTDDGTVSVLLGNGNLTFSPRVDYPVGERPKAVQTGDFNADGKLDFIAANEGGLSVTVHLGNGNGTFGGSIDSAAGCNYPHEIAIADLNGDSKLDALVPCHGGEIVSILFGSGNGGFQTPVNYTTGGAPHSAVIADFNKDGKLDFAIANHESGTVSVSLGTGVGAFAAAVPYPLGTKPHSVRAADLNKDGNLDLFTANDTSNNVSVLLGTGTGTFSLATNFNAGSAPKSVTSGDVDGDGNLDLVTANSDSNNVSVLLGTGSGSLIAPVNYSVGTAPYQAILVHLDGDGKLDIAAGNYHANNISILPSSGAFQLPPDTSYLSDLAWTSAVNGYGLVERDSSNGESGAGDGRAITLNGTSYVKGLGVHANSEIRYTIANCSNFSADVGVDDEVGSNGSVVFEVWLDSVKQFDSGRLNGDSAAMALNVSLTGKTDLRLIVTDAGDGDNYDHADWANARITCAAATAPPTVAGTSPTSGAVGVPLNTTVSATFSSAMQAGSLTTSTVTLRQGTATPLAATVAYNGTTQTVTLTPTAVLAASTTYTATVKGGTSGAKNSAGTPMTSDFSWSFTTAGTGGTTTFLSDLPWTSAVNGWGPVEKDHSNAEQAAGDGTAIRIAGVSYTKGLGVHASSDVRYGASGCTGFTSDVGVDTEVGTNGSVVFQVWVDGVKKYDSGPMTGGLAAKTASVALTGSNTELRLVVTDNGDGIGSDHADWAGARITCTADVVAPTVVSRTPAVGATGVSAGTQVTATFSEAMRAATLTTTTMTLVRQGTTTTLAGTVSYNPTTFTATLTPAAALTASTIYTATVKGGASGALDLAGNPLAADTSWSFTTGAGGPVTTYLSDRTPTSSINGWGPAEKDKSNGEQGAGDGVTITLNGTTYAKGIGAHAASDIRYSVTGCTAFATDVGVDDEVGSNGSVIFQVWVDGTKKYDSGLMTGATATKTTTVPLSGNTELRLVITDGGTNGINSDHADWAAARVTCGS
jgi:hypothetical protein